jgi:hypothetical protein
MKVLFCISVKNLAKFISKRFLKFAKVLAKKYFWHIFGENVNMPNLAELSLTVYKHFR